MTLHIPIFFVQYSTTAEEIRINGFRFLFRCLGKHLEHQRRDRNQYIRIFPENISPGNNHMKKLDDRARSTKYIINYIYTPTHTLTL